MSVDEAKAIVLDTCKSPLDMDIAQMRRGLEKWGLTIIDFERLTDPDRRITQEYMVWLRCWHRWEVANVHMTNWLTSMPDFPWVGKWNYIVSYDALNGKRDDFAVRVTHSIGHVYSIEPWYREWPWPGY